ncbi:Protein of unknown function [Thermoanaerobacter uzonensis DSM 18761]|uniref:DUF1648 domain-containing protein n=1 Tax=Thermoanaerobacter uzonensis DSM 18761 TaxID=1123369 RepID=A0A1M4TDM3_9THEO|nr:DUF1648 domain-containing protein [Thermoanaerobacter uzonensis]SHE42639.1 Protein of unknown function [Thermoanaerobacter uzonensis DSM 18761]
MGAINFLGKNNWLFAVFTFIINIIFYKALPENVAIQWHFDGSISNTVSKMTFVFILPLIQILFSGYVRLREKSIGETLYTYLYAIFVNLLMLIVDVIILIINLKAI